MEGDKERWGIGRVGARPRRAASLHGEQEALLQACPANVPEAEEKINISTSVVDGITEPRMSKSILHVFARINKISITITAKVKKRLYS